MLHLSISRSTSQSMEKVSFMVLLDDSNYLYLVYYIMGVTCPTLVTKHSQHFGNFSSLRPQNRTKISSFNVSRLTADSLNLSSKITNCETLWYQWEHVYQREEQMSLQEQITSCRVPRRRSEGQSLTFSLLTVSTTEIHHACAGSGGLFLFLQHYANSFNLLPVSVLN